MNGHLYSLEEGQDQMQLAWPDLPLTFEVCIFLPYVAIRACLL